MKKVILFSLILFLVIFNWSLNPAMKRAEAITKVKLLSPSDSTKMMTVTPNFKWETERDPSEIRKKYHVVVARDFKLADRLWEDSTILHPTQSIDYAGDPFVEWETYFWSARVQVDSIRSIDTNGTAIETTTVTIWWDFVRPRTFFYTTATLIQIPGNLPTIQEGIIWAASGDTVLVKKRPEPYYENLRFYKKGVMLASHFVFDTTKTAEIESTIIDGGKLTRGEDNGSVIYFTSKVDSSSKVIGFTIRNGTGTKSFVGPTEKVNGGGIFCEPGATPTIAYNVITGNHVLDEGGGIFCFSAAPNIYNNIITQNSAGGSGGAIQCYFSIRTKPPAGSSSPGGGENGGMEITPEASPIPIPTELNSEAEEDNLENSLYPRDATEVFPTRSSDPLFKAIQDTNRPPVPVVDYYPKKEKYFIGDTIWLDASLSFDPDSLDGDSIERYQWIGTAYYDCSDPTKSRPISSDIKDAFTSIAYFPIPTHELKTGICEFWVRVEDTHRERVNSEPFVLNIQRHPDAYVGDPIGIAPGDTVWLDASGSCDINPDDTLLSYHWTQISGPVMITLSDSQAIDPYFATQDSSVYLGEYLFQVVVCDSSENIDVDVTKVPPETTVTVVSDCDTAIAMVTCSNAPVAVAPPDSLSGYHIDELVPLDGSLSWDPDSLIGDYVAEFTWEGLTRTTCEGSFSFPMTHKTTKETTHVSFEEGGVYALSLSVKDNFGVESKNIDTLKISVQLRPKADAGRDTIVGRLARVYLIGDACEVNWDQRDSLKYVWIQDSLTNANALTWYDSVTDEKLYEYYAESQIIKFFAPDDSSLGGVYRFFLKVADPYQIGDPDDMVKVIINSLPRAVITAPAQADRFAEGDTVELDASESYDPDVKIFGDSLLFNWTAVNWPDYPDNTHKPNIIDSDLSIAKFVPLEHGIYRFQMLVHDTLSSKQHPSVKTGFNIDTVTVRVDTTFAYPIIRANLISSNTAGLKGGGIDCLQSSPDIINNIFYKNRSGSSGGAICTRFSSTPFINRNIFFGNISDDATGGAIGNLQAELSPAASFGFRPKMVVATNDFWDNAGGDFYNPSGDIFGNIEDYPRLIDPEYGNFQLECSSQRCLDDSIGLLLWLYPDTCETAPALSMISLSLFQHPVATAVVHFLVNTDVPLKAPPEVWIRIGGNSPELINFTSISSTTYRGEFVFSASGTANISVFVSSVREVPDTLTKEFTVQLIGAGKMGKLISHDGRIRALFPQGVAKGEIYATCIPVSDDPQHDFKDEQKITLGEAYKLGPLSDFKKEVSVNFPLGEYDLDEKEKTLFSIYKYGKNGWEKQTSFLDGNSICARVKELGIFRLVYDANQEHITAIPKTYQLFQNYPNPFNPETMIKYDLPNPGHVTIVVYNVLGQKVKTLVDEHKDTGHHTVNWDGKDKQGKEAASGIYFYEIKTPGFEKTKKMILLK